MDPSGKLECACILLVHGLIDDELDDVRSLIAERHLRTCPKCMAEYEATRSLKDMFASKQLRYRAPENLRAKTIALLEAESSALPRHIKRSEERDRRQHPQFWTAIQRFAIAASV